MEEDWSHENRTELTADNYYQLVRKSASKDSVRNSDQGKQQKNNFTNQGNPQQQKQVLQQRQQWQQQQPFLQQQQSQSPQTASIEELQAQLQLLERSTTALVSSDSKNQLIAQLHGDLTQLKVVVDKQNVLISQFERNSIEASTRLRLADIDQESAQQQITQLNNNLNNCQARNQALITANNELRAALEEANMQKEIAAQTLKDFQEKEIYLTGMQQEQSRINEKLSGELKDALSNLEKVKLELAQAKQIPSLRNLSSSNNNNNDDGSNTNNNNNNNNNNNQSFISDELHGNNTIITNINISMTSENMSERMKKYCADVDSFVANFLENKKYRVRSKQELKFFTEMAKMINFLKDQHAKLEEDFKEHMEITNRKTEELKGSMVATLAHLRILKESTNMSITELEKNLEKTNADKLELQKLKASQEVKLKENEAEIQKLKKKIEELNKNIVQNNKTIANLSSQVEENERNLIEKDEQMRNQGDQFRESKANYEQRLSEEAQKIQGLLEEIAEKNARIEEGIQREHEGELREKSINEHNTELQGELKDATGTIDELKQGISLLHEQIHQEQMQWEMKLQEAQKEIEGKNHLIETMKEQIEELNQAQAAIKMDSGRQHEEDIQGMQQLTEKIKELTANLKELETKGQFMEEDIRTYKRKISSLESKKDSARQDESQQLESALKTIQELQEEIAQKQERIDQFTGNLRENPSNACQADKSKKSSRNNSLAVPDANLPLHDGIEEDEDIQSSEKSPARSNRGSTTLDVKAVKSEQVEALKSENSDLKLQLQEQQEQVLELRDQLNSRDELLKQMTIEIQGIEKLHEDSILAAKAFNVKRQEELENRVFELMQNNTTLNEQLIAMQTTINYLHQIDAFFDKTSERKESQQSHEKIILGTLQSPPGKQQQFSEENQSFQGTNRGNGQHNRLRSPVRNSLAFKDSQLENTEEEQQQNKENTNNYSSSKSDQKYWQNQANNSHQYNYNEAAQGAMQFSDNKISSSSIQQKKMKVLVVELEERIKANQLLTERVSQLESYVELLENGNHSMKSAENNSHNNNNSDNNYISSGYSHNANSLNNNNNNNNSASRNYEFIKLEEDSHEQDNISNSHDAAALAGEDNHLQNSFVVPSFAINLQTSADMYSDNTNTLESHQVAEQIFFESNS